MRFLTYTRRTETRSCVAVCCRNALPICDIKGIQIVIMWPNLVQPSLRVNARENFSLLFTTKLFYSLQWPIHVFNSVVNTKLPAILSHWLSTTVSLETYSICSSEKFSLLWPPNWSGLGWVTWSLICMPLKSQIGSAFLQHTAVQDLVSVLHV